MQSFNEWLSLRNKIYYESFVFLEQGNLPVILPTPIEYPVGSGKRFWQIDDPDNPGEKIDISTALPNARQIATDLIRRNKQMGRTTPPGATPTGATPPDAPPTEEAEPSFINPQRGSGKNVIVNGQEMPLSSRNVTVKRMIAKRKSRPYASITDDEANIELAYMATEESEKDFMRMDGKQGDLKKIQQQFINRYGITPEEQMARGANKELTRLTPRKPEDWKGITIQKGRLPSRQPLPQFATILEPKKLPDQPARPTEQENTTKYKSLFTQAYGQDNRTWQPIARAAVDASLPGDPKADPTQQGRFLYHFDKEGPNYDVWTDEQRKEAGIDPNIRYKSPYDESEEEKEHFARRKAQYEKTYGPDKNKWQTVALMAAGILPMTDRYDQFKARTFALLVQEFGVDWTKWDSDAQERGGINDPRLKRGAFTGSQTTPPTKEAQPKETPPTAKTPPEKTPEGRTSTSSDPDELELEKLRKEHETKSIQSANLYKKEEYEKVEELDREIAQLEIRINYLQERIDKKKSGE